MPAPSARPALDLVALVRQELPALFEPGAFLVLSMRFPMGLGNALAYLQLLIDVHQGTCERAALDPMPLGRQVGAWLDAGVPASTPVTGVYTDNVKTVDRRTLTAWAATRGARAYYHPACTLPASVHGLFSSLMRDWANASWTTAAPDGLPAGRAALAAWRKAFNTNHL